ncbi:AraC family transcriptional regulator [Pedobacter sp. KBW06]|nr:AraC family transcriptional regulator [Pedobacter sp. KBW06]
MIQFLTIKSIQQQHQIDEDIRVNGIAIVENVHKLENHYTSFKHQFDGLIIAFCLKGKMTVKINFTTYEINTGSIVVVLPQLIIDPVSVSSDFQIVSIVMSLDFISAFPILRDFITNNEIRWHPVISSSEQENDSVEEFILFLKKYYVNKTKNPNNKKTVLQYLIFGLITTISSSYATLSNEPGMIRNRKNEIIDDFYLLISHYGSKERSASFYADKLHLSPQYLTTLVKNQTGKSIIQWIEHVVIMHAKSLLKSTSLSVKEISQELNFSDISLFCRYFKRCTHLTPNAFRKQLT